MQGLTEKECTQNVSERVHLLDSLGFTVHDKKSVLIPTQEIVFVGFVEIVSVSITVRLPDKKKEILLKLCRAALRSSHMTIR